MNESIGLCHHCVHARQVVTARGSRFVLCALAQTDDRFPRYPRVPVRTCEGFRDAGADEEERTREATP